MSDTTDDLWFLNEAESEQVSVEMKEAALEQGSDSESPQEEEEQGRDSKEDKEVKAATSPPLYHWCISIKLRWIIYLYIHIILRCRRSWMMTLSVSVMIQTPRFRRRYLFMDTCKVAYSVVKMFHRAFFYGENI